MITRGTGTSKGSRSQSAMEYLTTYSWMIAVVVIVFAALFMLGVFNPNLGPTAQPGSCSVYRPNGANTITGITLTGVCNNNIPTYVAVFKGTSNILVSPVPSLYTQPQATGLTISAWVYLTATQASQATAAVLSTYPINPTCGVALKLETATTLRFSDTCGHSYDTTNTLASNKWYNIVATISSGATPTETYYINGAKVDSGTSTAWSTGTTWTGLYIGSAANTIYFNGYLSNIQLYSAAFTQNEVTALYIGGIGGEPTALPWLMGWWPLNGNANDYAGNNDTSASNSVTYINQWTSGYTVP